MKTRTTLLCCMLCIILMYSLGTAHAEPLYTTTVPFFSDGLDLETGTLHSDPTVLVIVCGPDDQIEQVLKPAILNLADFSLYPETDMHFAYDPGSLAPILIEPDTWLEYAIVDDLFDVSAVDTLTFQEIDTDDVLAIHPDDTLLFRTSGFDLLTLDMTYSGGLDLDITTERLTPGGGTVPEPGTFFLMGLGLLGLVGRIFWQNHRKNATIKGISILFILIGFEIAANVAAQELSHPLVTVRKGGTGSGTVLIGEYTCDAWCPEMSVPYSDRTAIVLKVLPDDDSRFVRWEKEDGTTSSGSVHVASGEIVTAVFERIAGADGPDYVEHQVLVKVSPEVDNAVLQAVRQQVGVFEVETTNLPGWERWKMSANVEEALPILQEASILEHSEPNYLVTQDATIPNDTEFSRLWGLHNTGQSGGRVDADIDAPEAWDLHTGGNLAVAVIDTGVDYRHSDLAANMWRNPGEIPGNGQDDDGNGYVDDVYGYDFVNNDSDPFDDQGHGTHCAGTIAGVGNNGTGVTGVNWSARIMALKFLRSDGRGSTWDAIRAVQYATRMGVTISSNSWGGGGYSQALYETIQAAGHAGALFIAAAGNSNRNTDSVPHYPSSYNLDNIIAVASTDRYDNRSSFSNYGTTSVDLGAPGSSIYSTLPGNRYAYYSGTSMATPHVSGAASLIWARNSALTAAQVKDLLLSSVDQIAALQGRTVTGGRLNLFRAIQAVPTSGYASVSQGVTISSDPVVLGEDFSVSFTLREVRGLAKTFDRVAVAVLRADDSFVYDMAMYENVTIPASGTWSRTATSYLYPSREPGTYKIEIRGNVAGEWFAFDTVDSGVNPKIFQVVEPTAPDINILDIPSGSTRDVGFVEQSLHHRFYIQNLGDGSLHLTGSPYVQIAGDPEFVVTAQPATGTIAPGETVSFDITFYPSAATTFSAEVSLPNTDPDENPYTFTITGAGKLPRVTGVSATDGTYANRVRVTWDSVPDAAYYRVYRNTVAWPFDPIPLTPWQTTRTYDDYAVTSGETYYYWVTAAKDTAGAHESWYSVYDRGHAAIEVAKPDL